MEKLHGRSVLVTDGNVENKKKIQADGLLNDLREREFYIKPTTQRKLKASAAKQRWRKKLREQELPKKQF